MKKLKDLTSKDYKNLYENYLITLLFISGIARRIWHNDITEVVSDVFAILFLLCLAVAVYKAWRETGSFKEALKFNKFWLILLSVIWVLGLILIILRG